LSAVAAGMGSGIIGFTGFAGFIFYLLFFFLTSVVLMIKLKFQNTPYFSTKREIIFAGIQSHLLVINSILNSF
jgi:hypothetical protein